jgi:hypothetical protein
MAANPQQQTQKSPAGVDVTLARHGGLSYLEIPAVDVRQSAAFYASVVGWNVEGLDTDATGHLIGRWITKLAVVREPGLLPYFYVDDVREAVAAAVANGGEVVKAPYSEGNLLVATVRDPAGNVIGLWQEGPR